MDLLQENSMGGETTVRQQFQVAAEDAGTRLDLLLLRRYPLLNRDRWQARIRSGGVTVNGSTARPSRRMQEGELVDFIFKKRAEPHVNRNVEVLLEDDDLLILDKPSNLPVHPSGGYFKNTLYFILKEMYGDEFTTHFVHRLDRETSGAILLAKSSASSNLLQKLFLERTVRKEYLVIVEGIFPDFLDARGILTDHPDSPVRKKRHFIPDDGSIPEGSLSFFAGDGPSPAGGETARTEFFLLATDGELSLLRAKLHTGRMHQIRATLCSLGYPVVGDRLYGVDDRYYIQFIEGKETEEDQRRLRLNRTALHSHILEFPHPSTGERVFVRSPMPEDMKRIASFAPEHLLGFS